MKFEKPIRKTAMVISQLLAVATALYQIPKGICEGTLLALLTPMLLLAPLAVEKLLRCRLSLPMYLFSLFYALGPMLGQCWKLYYLTRWWDKLLHISGGIAFALLGWLLFQMLTAPVQNRLLCALFALTFSIAVSAVWEFWEFGADRLFAMDMQNDMVITGFISYDLGPEPGVLGEIRDIHQVSIDGTPLPFDGYLDIGLHDTMWDMILESAGALLTVSFCFRRKKAFFVQDTAFG